MSGIDSKTDPPATPEEPVTEQLVIPARASSRPSAAVPPSLSAPLPYDPTSEPDDWPTRGPAKGIRVAWPVMILLVVLIAGGGIWGGAALQRSQNSNSSAGSLFSTLASRFADRTGGTRAGGAGTTGRGTTGSGTTGGGFGGFGGAKAATTGTVTEVKGSILYVTNSSGNLVEVDLSSSTTVTRDAKSTPSGLVPGDTVVVEGSTEKNGTVSASSVSATADGVSTGFGGFGG